MGWGEVARLCGVDVPAVSRAVKSLEQTGVLRRLKLSRSGRGFTGYELVFDGLAVCRLIESNGYAALLAVARGILEYHRMLPSVAEEGGSRLADSATRPEEGSRLAESTTPDTDEARLVESARRSDDDLNKIINNSEMPSFRCRDRGSMYSGFGFAQRILFNSDSLCKLCFYCSGLEFFGISETWTCTLRRRSEQISLLRFGS